MQDSGDLSIFPKCLVQTQCLVAMHLATPHPIPGTSLVGVRSLATQFEAMPHMFHTAESLVMPCLLLGMSLDQVQCHAATFFAMPRMTLHATEFYATSCAIFHATEFLATPHLILGMLLHVLMMIAIESQKLILYTSDVADAKVITTGEPTTPSLLIIALPSINDLLAGDSCAHDLLQAQPVTSQHTLRNSVDLDDLPL